MSVCCRAPEKKSPTLPVLVFLGVWAQEWALAGRRARRAHDRLLQDLRRRVGRRSMVVVLLEALVARARVDRERHGRAALHRREVDREGNQAEIGLGETVSLSNGE